jgi:choline dehydrogenase-like flavoprotein
LGTCRIGTDPATSVLDPWCGFHGVPNLFVVDGSFLPSSGGVNPSLTIAANGFRVGEHLVRHWDDRVGGREP